jgi:hypothetical protein
MGLEMIPAIESAAETKARYPDKLYESHPEVVFAVMAGGIIPVNKKTLSGTLGRAHYLSARLGFDCLKWVMTQEARFDIEADDWLDSLSMALVAYDWRLPAQRRMLATADGAVRRWGTQSDRLMAIPCTEIAELPKRLPTDEFIELIAEHKGPR